MKFYLLVIILLFPILLSAEPVKYANSYSIESKAFGEPREIMVSLPESYEKDSALLYPVIYTVRGQLDLLSVVASIDMLDSEAPEFIVVGISGSGSEFIPNEKGEQSKFSKLLHDEVVPYIKESYKTAPYSILVGHSAAGKFVTNDWLNRGSDFSSYYAISPELHDGAINKRAKSLDPDKFSKKNPLLISTGREGKRMQSMFDELKSIPDFAARANFIQFDDQTHMSGRVHTVMAGLRSSFANWKPSRKVESGKFEGLKNHYKQLSDRYGYEVPIPMETMKRESAFHSASDIEERWQVASEIVKYALMKNPSNVDEFIEISEEMKAYGMSDGSKRLISYVCNELPEQDLCKE